MEWTEFRKELEFSLQSNKTENTFLVYTQVWNEMIDFPSLEYLKALTTMWHSKGLTNKTIVVRYSAIRYIMTNYPEMFSDHEIGKMIRYMKETKADTRVVPVARPKQIAELLDAEDITAREACCIALMYYAGLRVGEVAMLNLDDVTQEHIVLPNDPKEGRTTKGKAGREIPMHPQLWKYIQEYLTDYRPFVERRRNFKNGERLILGRCGGLDRKSIWRIVKDACISHGYPDLNDHAFRHGIATEMNKKGIPIAVIQHLLGHADIKTTQKYIGVDQEDIEKALLQID